ncbi:hypothetical protein M9Y10_036584 [Tritrichomonas musculus]|uniref:Uncharacterized protein n=1 Tax=Tritrichomonas musculus TaxID=1915356 RepID=A0ABR2GUG3_9EUKA
MKNEKMNGKILLIENKCNKNVEELNRIKTIKNSESVIINDIKLIKSEINKLNKKEQFVIPDEIYENIQNAQDSANKANSKCDMLRSENDNIREALRCLKYEAKKLKNTMNSGELIPDDIYDNIQQAQDSANKANSKCDMLRSENDNIREALKCLKYEAKKLKERPIMQNTMNSGELIPDDIYENIRNAQNSANKANTKCDILRSENDNIREALKCLKYEVKKIKVPETNFNSPS